LKASGSCINTNIFISELMGKSGQKKIEKKRKSTWKDDTVIPTKDSFLTKERIDFHKSCQISLLVGRPLKYNMLVVVTNNSPFLFLLKKRELKLNTIIYHHNLL